MSQNGKLMPNLDQESTKVLNLTVLQRIDPFVEEILMTAAHVTFYEFNIELNQWVVDAFAPLDSVDFGSILGLHRLIGFFFFFSVFCLGRVGRTWRDRCLSLKDNLVEDLLGDFEYEVQVPYILYRNAVQEVNGIWFYNSLDCEAVANLFSRILNAYSKVPPKPKVSSNKSEFEELEAVPTLSVIEGPLEPPTTATSTAVPDDSFLNFFTAATNIGNASNSANAAPLHVAPQPAPTIPLSTHPPAVTPSPMPPVQPSPLQPSSTPLVPLLDTTLHESVKTGSSSSSRPADLVKPSFFSPIPPASSAQLMMPSMISTSMPTAPPLHPPVTMQRPPPYGTPLLQPFPPPAPSASLTPAHGGPVITRDKVRDALSRLVQNDHFVDMVYREILSAHYS